MSRRRKAFLTLLIFLTLALTMLFLPRRVGPGPVTGAEPLAFSQSGPHPVGVQRLAASGERLIDLTLWYPAMMDDETDFETAYPFEIGIGGPLGEISIAEISGQAEDGAPPNEDAGPYPLVILSPGFAIGPTAYAWLAEHVASHGFVVIATGHEEALASAASQFWRAAITRPNEVRSVLDYAAAPSDAGGAFDGLIDPATIAVVGHSIGGYTALAAAGARFDIDDFKERCEQARAQDDPSAWLCDLFLPNLDGMAELAGYASAPEGLWPSNGDDRVDAVISMAGDAYLFGQAGLAEVTIPVLAIGGTGDGDTPYLWGTSPTYAYAASEVKARIGLQEADHMIFTGSCDRVSWIAEVVFSGFCSDPTWEKESAHNLIRHLAAAFLLATLQQDPDAAAALAQDAVDFENVSYDAQGFVPEP